MSASRKLYRDVATGILDEMHFAEGNKSMQLTIATVARSVASSFKAERSEFRYDKFYEACGLTEWGEPKR